MRIRTLSICSPALLLLVCVDVVMLGGCDTITSDFGQFTDSFSPPTPAQAAQWAADPNDNENARRGTILLANAPWGGAPPYVRMYRLYAEDSLDPLVRAAALQALGRHGDPDDAVLVAKNLTSPFRQVRLAAARSSQRLHDPAVADQLWPRLVDGSEDSDVRIEIAIALAQYPTPAVFRALVAALAQRELAVNVASVDSLRTMTGQNIALDENAWLLYYAATPEPFAQTRITLYPTFVRALDIWDRLLFWDPVVFESPDVPVGLQAFGVRRTNDAAREDAPVVPETLLVPETPVKPVDSATSAGAASAASDNIPGDGRASIERVPVDFACATGFAWRTA